MNPSDRDDLAHELVGVAEITEILGVARGSARAYMAGRHPRGIGAPPPPVAELQMGRVWLRSEIELWAFGRLQRRETLSARRTK